MLHRALQDEQAEGIVGARMRTDFLLHHSRGLATQDVHLHRRFDIAKEQLNAPPAAVELSSLLYRIATGIGERSSDPHALSSKAFAHDGHLVDAHFELLLQRFQLGGIPWTLGGSMYWLLPNLQALVGTQ